MSLDGWRKQAEWEQRWPRTADCSRVDYRQLGKHGRPWWQAALAWQTVHRTMPNAGASDWCRRRDVCRQIDSMAPDQIVRKYTIAGKNTNTLVRCMIICTPSDKFILLLYVRDCRWNRFYWFSRADRCGRWYWSCCHRFVYLFLNVIVCMFALSKRNLQL